MNNTRSRRKKKRYQRECDEIERRLADGTQPSDPFAADPFEDWAGDTPNDPFSAKPETTDPFAPDPFEDWAGDTPADKDDPFG